MLSRYFFHRAVHHKSLLHLKNIAVNFHSHPVPKAALPFCRKMLLSLFCRRVFLPGQGLLVSMLCLYPGLNNKPPCTKPGLISPCWYHLSFRQQFSSASHNCADDSVQKQN